MLYFLLLASPLLAIFLACLGVESQRQNLLGWFLVLIGLGYLTGGMIYAWRMRGNLPPIREESGDRSFWLILPGFILVFFGSPIEFLYVPETLPRALGMQIAGLGLILVAVILRIWTRLAIREMYAGHVQIQPGHRLVQQGPYGYVRHPGYTGYLLMTLGVAIGYASLIGLGSIFLALLPGLDYRMKVEEKLLEEHFGEGYRQYAGKTGRLLPKLWK